MFCLQLKQRLFSCSALPRLISACSASTSNKDKLPSKVGQVKKNPDEIWKERGKLALPKLQRDEDQIPPKRYWVEDWKLETEDEKYSPLKEYGTNTKKWDYYSKVIWPPNYVVPETGLPKAREVFHYINSIHYSPKRMWYICQFIRRMNVDEAIKQLMFKKNKGTIIMSGLLKETKKLAKDKFYISNPSNMFVAEAFPIQKFIVKGMRRHAHDRMAKRRFRYIDVFVRLEEGSPPDYKGREKLLNGWQKMEKYYEYLRNRDFKYSL